MPSPQDIIQMMRRGQNPQQIAMSFLEGQMSNTPMGQNLLELVKANKTADIEQIARNLCKQKGLDFDTEFKAFRQQLGL